MPPPDRDSKTLDLNVRLRSWWTNRIFCFFFDSNLANTCSPYLIFLNSLALPLQTRSLDNFKASLLNDLPVNSILSMFAGGPFARLLREFKLRPKRSREDHAKPVLPLVTFLGKLPNDEPVSSLLSSKLEPSLCWFKFDKAILG